MFMHALVPQFISLPFYYKFVFQFAKLAEMVHQPGWVHQSGYIGIPGLTCKNRGKNIEAQLAMHDSM